MCWHPDKDKVHIGISGYLFRKYFYPLVLCVCFFSWLFIKAPDHTGTFLSDRYHFGASEDLSWLSRQTDEWPWASLHSDTERSQTDVLTSVWERSVKSWPLVLPPAAYQSLPCSSMEDEYKRLKDWKLIMTHRCGQRSWLTWAVLSSTCLKAS